MADETDKPSSTLPKPGDILQSIATSEQEVRQPKRNQERFETRFARSAVANDEEYAHLFGIRDHYKQKRNWSRFLIWLVGGMIVFQSVLLWRVGTGALDFTQYTWLLPALLAQNFGQVIGLAIFAVRHLFSDIRPKG